MWSDVCLRLKCPKDTPVKIVQMRDLRDKRAEGTLMDLGSLDYLVVIMPDHQNCLVWQMLEAFTVRKYFYHPHNKLLGVAGWTHWALLIDWSKRNEFDETIKPGREYSAAELEGKVQRTQSSRRRYRKREFESQPGFVPHKR
jgi:hypothetical protein